MGARIIAIGQRVAGDDAVGLVVLDRLRQAELPGGTELVEAGDATALIPLLETRLSVIVLDAVVGPGPVGEILELDADALEGASERPVSTHGVSVPQALALARLLSPEAVAPSVSIVGVRIPPPRRYTEGLSPGVAEAVANAASLVVARIGAL
jgi:hydrogenase maturation protease